MATSEPTDNDTYATALSQGYESQPLLTPVDERDDEEQSNDSHHAPIPPCSDPVRFNSTDADVPQSTSGTGSTDTLMDTGTATISTRIERTPQVLDPIQTLCKATHYELTNLGKALTCPICCSTYSQNNAVILPCVHAYCRTCIVQALRFKPECPTCKQPTSKRSLVDCPVLNEMAVAYKQVTRALGWSPSVYSNMVEMTQLPPPVHDDDNDDHDDDDNNNSNHVPLADCREQWQASKTWARVMEQEEDDDQNPMLREERRRVAEINKQAVGRAAAAAALGRNKRQPKMHSNKAEANKSVSFVADIISKEDEPAATAQEGGWSFSNDDVANDKSSATIVAPIDPGTPTLRQQEHASAMIGVVNTTACGVPQHDSDRRNTASGPRDRVQSQNEKDMVRANIVEEVIHGHSGNISIRTQESELPSHEKVHGGNRVSSKTNNMRPDDLVGVAVSEEVVVTERLPQGGDFNDEDTADEVDDPKSSMATPIPDEEARGTITVGSIVRVQSRTWPGINKPGGVARVTCVHADSHAYDVAFVLGGVEKRVGAAHIALEESHHPTSQRARRGRDEIPVSVLQALARDGFDLARTDPKAATKRTHKRAQKENRNTQVSRKEPCDAATTSITTKCIKRKELTHDGASSSRKKARASQVEVKLPELSNDMKCMLANDRYQALIDASVKKGLLNVVVSSLPEEEQTILDVLVGDSKNQGGTHLFHLNCVLVKAMIVLTFPFQSAVKLKIQDVFNPKTTNLIIMPSENKEETGLARVRTLKAMRASLAGTPLVTPEWISLCRSNGKVVAPDSTMFIHSLPTKTNDLGDSLYGTALVAARLQQVENGTLPKDSDILPLKHAIVNVCGPFVRPPKADVQLLVRESGATLQPSIAATIKLLKSASFEFDGQVVAFLCDDTSDNAQCGITVAQARDIELAIRAYPGRVVVVNAHWLFDVVTCGKQIPGELFPPKSLRCKELWSTSR